MSEEQEQQEQQEQEEQKQQEHQQHVQQEQVQQQEEQQKRKEKNKHKQKQQVQHEQDQQKQLEQNSNTEQEIQNSKKLETDTNESKNQSYFFGDEYLFYVTTHNHRHNYVKRAKSLWGRYIKNFLAFSEHEDPSVPTIKCENFREGMKSYDARQPWIVYPSIRYLYKNHKDIKFFIKMDDDTFPILDSLKQVIDNYVQQLGDFPYLLGSRVYNGYYNKKLANWSVDQEKIEKLTNGKAVIGLLGNMFGFNQKFLSDIIDYADEEKYPVMKGQDFALGALWLYSGKQNDSLRKSLPGNFNSPIKAGLTQDSPKSSWSGYCFFHHVKDEEQLETFWDWYYQKFDVKP